MNWVNTSTKKAGRRFWQRWKDASGGRRDEGEERLGAFERLVEGLGQGPGRLEDHGEPELHEGLERPAALQFADADGGENALAEGGGDVGAQKLQDADEIDRHWGRARWAHSPSFHEKVYGSPVSQIRVVGEET